MSWWRRLAGYGRPHAGLLAVAAALLGLQAVLEAAQPWPLKLLVDHVLVSKPFPGSLAWLERLPAAGSTGGRILWLCAATVLLAAALRVSLLGLEWLETRIGIRVVYGLGADLFAHLQRLSLGYHARRPRADLVQRVVTDSACVQELLLGVLLPSLGASLSLLVMFLVMWGLDPGLALLAILAAPALGVLSRLLVPSLTRLARARQEAEAERLAAAEQALQALPLVQTHATEAREVARLEGTGRAALRAQQRSSIADLSFTAAVGGVTALATALLFWRGGTHVLEGRLGVGSLLVFLAYLSALFAPMETLARLASGLASAGGKARRVLEALEVDDGVREAPGAPAIRTLAAGDLGLVELRHVSFGYEAGRAVLEEVDLRLDPGDTVALVGPSGAGKSTLASLIPRFADPWLGEVRVGGVDVRAVGLRSLRDGFSLVLQEPFLLPLTVAENIAYGRPGASREAIVRAARAAQAHEFILRLPAGYDTPLGERGARLSGGERQRLAIARALLKEAPILLLDEPTSALDAATEAALLAALDLRAGSRTTLMIAHRLSTARRARRIVVLDRGRIVEQGSHLELLAAGGLYARLHRAGEAGGPPRPGHGGAG